MSTTKPKRYSPSKLLKYIECPAQYADLYGREWEHRVKQEPSAIPDAGKIAHKVLELAGKRRIGKPLADREKVTKKELLELLEIALRDPPDQSWKDPTLLTPEVAESAARLLSTPNCWKKVSFAHTIEVERPFAQPISGGPKFRSILQPFELTGIIDRIDEMPDGRIKIVDYKTGWSVMSRAEAELDPQVNMYLAAASRLFPDRQVDIELHYLSRGVRLGPIHHSPSREEWLFPFIRAVVYRITTWDKFPETPGMPQCMSCHRRSVCKSYESMLTGTMAPGNRTMAENLASYDLLSSIEKAAETGKKTLRKVINQACSDADDGEVFGGEYKARLTFKNKTEYTDMRRTSIAAARSWLPMAKPIEAPPIEEVKVEPIVVQDGLDELSKATKMNEELTKRHEDLVKKHNEMLAEAAKLRLTNERLQRAALEIRTAFDIACSIGKVQSGLVDDFTESIPGTEERARVCTAIESTASNGGYYSIDVERLSNPFYDAEPSAEEIALAVKQDALYAKKPVAALTTTATTPVEAPPTQETAPEATTLSAPALEVATNTAPSAPVESSHPAQASAPKEPPAEVPVPEKPAAKKGGKAKAEAAKPEWAQPDCVACGGSGRSSRGGECMACRRKHELTQKALQQQPDTKPLEDNAKPPVAVVAQEPDPAPAQTPAVPAPIMLESATPPQEKPAEKPPEPVVAAAAQSGLFDQIIGDGSTSDDW